MAAFTGSADTVIQSTWMVLWGEKGRRKRGKEGGREGKKGGRELDLSI